MGFGFGAIQGGLFIPEAFNSNRFDRIVVSEVDPITVEDIRKSNGTYFCNVAEPDCLRSVKVEGLEIYNPLISEDREKLVDAIAEAQEMCTALPSFKLYDHGDASVARLLCHGLELKKNSSNLPSAVIYAAENDTRAAKRLHKACLQYLPDLSEDWVVFSETVIAKMCSVVVDEKRIKDEGLSSVTEVSEKAFLMEAFNHILIEERIPLSFKSGFKNFSTRRDLNPFAIAKFLGHNAMHALLGYLAKHEGITYMHQTRERSDLLDVVKNSFINEAGAGLRKEFQYLDDFMFTEEGFEKYAEDAIFRMVNPFLRDPVDRVTRDPIRKLGWEDRLIGSMKLAIRASVEPRLLAKGAALALQFACEENNWSSPEYGLDNVWKNIDTSQKSIVRSLILASC